MASTPDQNPDSIPLDDDRGDIEHVSPASEPGRTSVEDTPGTDGGTAGTGDQARVQDEQFER